ncbi:class I SAM-dependent methyltransferase [bacterium]|nr:MAG: class I SAM-dependent methyltransferase [bacterium]
MEIMENKIENWEHGYKLLGVTYTEQVDKPTNLEQMYSYEFVRKHIVDNLPDTNKLRILEVGCGGARNALYLALRGFDVTCSDYSPEGLNVAQMNFNAFGAKGTFLLDDLMNSKIAEGSYDCVMSFGLLEHFDDLYPLIKNLTRMVKPGGIQIHLVIPKKFSTTTMRDFVLFPAKLVRNIIKRDFRDIFRRSYRDFPHYENRFSWKQYCNVFNEQGNDVIKCEPGGLILPFMMFPLEIGGKLIVKLFHKQILFINDVVKRSTHPFTYFLSTTFTIVCRKK